LAKIAEGDGSGSYDGRSWRWYGSLWELGLVMSSGQTRRLVTLLQRGHPVILVEDALSPQESTARTLVNQVFHTGARQVLLCGDSTLALAVMLELARSSWERTGLDSAAANGEAPGLPAPSGLARPPGQGPQAAPDYDVIWEGRAPGQAGKRPAARIPRQYFFCDHCGTAGC